MKKLFLSLSVFCLAATVFALPDLIERQIFNSQNIKNIDLNLIWEDIKIQESPDDDNIVVEIYCNNEKAAPKIQKSNSSIAVKSVNTKNFLFIGPTRICTVIVKLPVTLNLEKIDLSTTSGDISADLICAQTLKASSTSGRIKFSNIKVEQAKIGTTSANITVEGLISNEFNISCTSGMINLDLDDVPSSNSSAQTTSGNIFLGLPGNSSFKLKADTTSGTFINTFTNEKIGDHADYKREINNGGTTIKLSATSGRITVDATDGVTTKALNPTTDSDIPVVSFDDPIF